MFLTENELKRGDALRSAIRARRFYTVGSIRNAINKKTRFSFGRKVIIIGIEPHRNRKSKISFRKLRNC